MSKLRVEYFGITDECGTCECCGKTNLRKAVMLFVLDADGNRDELVYYGTTCAAKALSVRPTQVTRMAEEANRERLEKLDRLTRILTDTYSNGRYLVQARTEFNRNASQGRMSVVNGVEYGPDAPEGFRMQAYSAAREAQWRAELALLGVFGNFKGTRPESNRFTMTGW